MVFLFHLLVQNWELIWKKEQNLHDQYADGNSGIDVDRPKPPQISSTYFILFILFTTAAII